MDSGFSSLDNIRQMKKVYREYNITHKYAYNNQESIEIFSENPWKANLPIKGNEIEQFPPEPSDTLSVFNKDFMRTLEYNYQSSQDWSDSQLKIYKLNDEAMNASSVFNSEVNGIFNTTNIDNSLEFYSKAYFKGCDEKLYNTQGILYTSNNDGSQHDIETMQKNYSYTENEIYVEKVSGMTIKAHSEYQV